MAIARSVVNVTGESPLIHVENGDASSTMSTLRIAQVPNPGSDLSYVLTASPGAIVSTDGTSGGTSILGMPGHSNLFTLNGMTYTDLESGKNEGGATNLWLGLNAVEEATVVSNGYSGRSGTLAGAEVNYITRSGECGDENTATGYQFTINCIVYGDRYPVAAFPPKRGFTHCAKHAWDQSMQHDALARWLLARRQPQEHRRQTREPTGP